MSYMSIVSQDIHFTSNRFDSFLEDFSAPEIYINSSNVYSYIHFLIRENIQTFLKEVLVRV